MRTHNTHTHTHTHTTYTESDITFGFSSPCTTLRTRIHRDLSYIDPRVRVLNYFWLK